MTISEEVELAWAAGFFDGEGCVWLKKVKHWRYAIVEITQVHTVPLERWLNALELDNKVYEKKRVKGVARYSIAIARQEVVREIFEKLSPYLCSIKYAQFKEVLEEAEVNDYL